jgi:glyceraldehyde-3-phosphate dehydrogenase/erythrose-4-phosphate dehydrogenase
MPATAGMPSDRARMATCEVAPPRIVQNPTTVEWSSAAASEGARSSVQHGVRGVDRLAHIYFGEQRRHAPAHVAQIVRALGEQFIAQRREAIRSGAARALAFIWPGLRISGKAYRVPARTGSIAELNLLTERAVSVDEVNEALRSAASVPPLHGVMSVLEDEWASSRIVGDPHSSIVDLPLTATQGDLLSVAAWYDNEMGYSTRLAETAARIAVPVP